MLAMFVDSVCFGKRVYVRGNLRRHILSDDSLPRYPIYPEITIA